MVAFHKHSNIVFRFLVLAPVALQKHHLTNSQCATKVTPGSVWRPQVGVSHSLSMGTDRDTG